MASPDRTERLPTLRESVPPLREWVSTFFVGLFMGTADAVPGVSGGTIALIAGVYERLISAITAVTPARFLRGVRALTPLDGGISFRRAVAVLEEVDAWFLFALLGGILTAVILVTNAVTVLSEEAPVLLFGFFFGLIAASAVVLLRAVTIQSVPEIVAAVAGFTVAFVVSGISDTVLATGGIGVTFLAGMLAVSAMILPGISGSLLLVILGQYEFLTATLSSFVNRIGALATGGSTDALVAPGTTVVTFVLGGLTGLFTISRAVRWALEGNRDVTLAFLIALVVGALRAPIHHLRAEKGIAFTTGVLGQFAVAAVVGAVVVLVLDWYAPEFDIETI